jgi:hypothetical protein
MAKFFIDRPIVAMVISILMVIIGVVAMAQLPIAQYPNIAPPEMLLTANYPGADAVTLEQSVATPIAKNSPMLQGGETFSGDDWQAGMDLTFELDLWGRLRRGTEAARAELLASEETRRVVLMTLVADVARTHFDLLELDHELEIARRTLQTRQASLELQRRRFEQGLSTQLDVDRADAEVAVAAATVPDLERRIAQTENGLSVLCSSAAIPVPSLAGLHSTGNAWRRRCRRGYPRRCSSAGPTFARPNRRSSPPTRGSVWPRRNTSPRSRSPACSASRACRCPISSPGGHGFGRSVPP